MIALYSSCPHETRRTTLDSYSPRHSLSYFRTEETGESMLLIPVGNVTADTELSYEYGARTTKNQPKTTPDGDDKHGGTVCHSP